MATPKQPPPKQPPASKPPPRVTYTQALEEAMNEFNAAMSAFNAWNEGYREVWQTMIAAARKLRTLGVTLPAMPGEQMMPPPAAAPAAPLDVDAEIRAAISASHPGVKPPVTSTAGPKTSKE